MAASAIYNSKNRFASSITVTEINWEDNNDDLLSTGSVGLNAALGASGLPKGRLIEIYGKYGTGKTTLALAVTALAQRNQRARTAYLDSEQKLSKAWIKKLGVAFDQTLWLQPSEASDALRTLFYLVTSGDFQLVVLDSLAALVPWTTIEEANLGTFSGELESALERTLPSIAAAARKTNTCVLLLNQARQDNDLLQHLTSPGGHVVRHTCSIRIELAKKTAIKLGSTEKAIGTLTTAKIMRNSLGPSLTQATIPFTQDRGLDHIYESIIVGKQFGVFDEKSVLTFRNVRLGACDQQAYEFLLEHQDTAEEILAAAATKAKQRPSIVCA